MKVIALILAFSIFISKPQKIVTSYSSIVTTITPKQDYTIVYLWKPWCKPCIDNIPYLSRLKKLANVNVVLLTTVDENVDIASKYGFDTCFYFNKEIYKTHTRDYDEYDQFNKEVFVSQKMEQPIERGICPAVFLFNKEGKLLHFNNDLSTKIDTNAVKKIIKY